ncbi:Gfo/Idh/MocA family protein [Dyadobacter tibetensis]|uniref:Gfo/Idh/MocA family protein n=1 Tax=Dyadobacter tibetensis TaxID=1211851 RepID=UPI000472FA4B|nr:Gfo/Idh/MocA family oxidoreductase [Dyadobacter tibetensis]
MKESEDTRRSFLRTSMGTAAGLLLLPTLPLQPVVAAPAIISSRSKLDTKSRIKFSVIGMNHGHIYGQVEAVIRGGGELVSFYAKEKELSAAFSKRYPNAKMARDEREILEDKQVQLILSAGIPNERAPLGIRVMKAGKDYMSDKPAITTLEQLEEVRKVQKETKQIFSIMYSERLENRATVKAGELVKAGAIGQVVQTIGLGPHRMNPDSRPEWFFDKEKFGGIICDIASHQFDQFLFFTNSTSGAIVASQVGNVNHPQYPQFQDFGDAMVRGNGGSGYIRVDWFTPDGLKSWGDGRLTILGTDGYIEIRKNVDISGRTGGNHLFLVDNKDTKYIDSSDTDLSYGRQLVDDVINRTETAMPQAHCFLATELALKAQNSASVLTKS